MDTTGIALLIAGFASIAVAIFGKIRPDIIYRNYDRKTAFGGAFRLFGGSAFRVFNDKMDPEVKQRIGFVVYILLGIVLITMGLLR